MLIRGSKGGNVRRVQMFLAAQGLYDGRIDSFYGVQTARAVEAWQRHVGVEADGVFGPQTLGATTKEMMGSGPGGPAVRPVRTDG
jgi:peptidoglycan hydrolase-like protein with peptidoglycan-binding domain